MFSKTIHLLGTKLKSSGSWCAVIAIACWMVASVAQAQHRVPAGMFASWPSRLATQGYPPQGGQQAWQSAEQTSGYESAETTKPIDADLMLAQYGETPPVYLNDCLDCSPRNGWFHEILPDGLIYHSYMAGPRESRIQLNMMQETGSKLSLWDVTLGGRRGIWRYGNGNALKPEGWQLDIEGAALVRLNIDSHRDLDSSDFRFGVPLTYGCGKWQYKVGYYHLSSHLGDELMVRTPGATRKNYVRDAIIFGASYNPTPAWRLYGETAYAFFTNGGAEPWEFQFGAEYSQPGPTGARGTPFFATNGHLREELNFGGDYTLQLGWLWRGNSGSMFRTGFQYMTGHSNFYQFYNESEEQYGWALWYDY